MGKSKYDFLKNISLEEFGLIKMSLSDSVYKFCVLNKITNLGDFLECYKNNRYKMSNKHNFYYFDGMCDLINLMFFDEEVSVGAELVKEIKIVKYSNSYKRAMVEDDHYSSSLRRLGFDKSESDYILHTVLCMDRNMTIIKAIKFCLNNCDIKNIETRNRFTKKLGLLSGYYDKNKLSLDYIDSCLFYDAKCDLDELRKIYNKIRLLKEKSDILSIKFKDKVSRLPQNEECVKKLVKIFQEIDCKDK